MGVSHVSVTWLDQKAQYVTKTRLWPSAHANRTLVPLGAMFHWLGTATGFWMTFDLRQKMLSYQRLVKYLLPPKLGKARFSDSPNFTSNTDTAEKRHNT